MALTDEIARLAAGFSGTLGVWAHSLDGGETIEWNATEAYPAASTIKLPILYEVFRQAGERRFRMDDTRMLEAGDVVPGSGILKDLTPGLALTVRDLATLMIVVSDNTATNMLIDLVGLEAVNTSTAALGLGGTRLAFKLFRAPQGPPRNVSTPRDLGRLMTLIATRAVLTPPACDEMLAILGRQHFTDLITRRLSDYDGFLEAGKVPVVTVASKSGSIRGTRNDVGLVSAHGRRYVIAMMSKGCKDPRFYHDNEAALLLPEVSAAVYRHFVGRG
ncbi:MAG: serine hydrolase [Armatimonadota bacterium]|nr:serine hydrolase [Armatimonadota bacterium]